MFPLNANDPYIKATGERSTLGSVIGGGGGGQSGGTNILTGTTIPDNSIGNEGDIYLLIPNEVNQEFTITVTKALRGTSEQSYYGAQEIQLLFTNGTTTKDIIEFTDFYCSGPSGVDNAFNGLTTTGSYFEANGLPGVINFGAKIPLGWTLDKLVVWQRNSTTYLDVWKDFTFSVSGVPVLTETNLSTSDWAGPGLGTEFELPSVKLKNIQNVYYKVNNNGSVSWIF